MPTLNEKFIKLLSAPESKHKIYWDDKVIGLGIRITNNNARSFLLDYVINGRRRRYTIGGFPELSVTAAREIAIKLKGEIIDGHDPLEKRQDAHNLPTLKDFSVEFLKVKEKSLKPKTFKDYKFTFLEKHIIPQFGKHRLDSIKKKDLEIFHASLSHTPRMANILINLLRSMFNAAIAWDLIIKNPAVGIKKFPEHKRERYLSDEEIKRLVEVLEKEEGLNVCAIKLILLTGSRKSEVLSARWQDFDFENNIWIKPASLTKQNKTSHIPLNKDALDILQNMKKNIVPDNKVNQCNENQIISSRIHLFYNPKTKTNLKDIKKFWATVSKKAEIKNARIHDLRHTFASILVSNGVSLEVISKLIGHSNITTTQRYSHLANTPLKQATEMLAQKVGGR